MKKGNAIPIIEQNNFLYKLECLVGISTTKKYRISTREITVMSRMSPV